MKRVLLALIVLPLVVSVSPAAEPMGAVRVTGPAGMRVLVDGETADVPKAGGGVLVGVPEGRRVVTVELPGEEPLTRVVQVEEGRTVELRWGRDSEPGDGEAGAIGRPFLAAVPHCVDPELPKPEESAGDLRSLLEAEGRWQRAGAPLLTPPSDPQLNDTWLWYIWDLGGYPTATLKPCTVRGDRAQLLHRGRRTTSGT